MITTKALALAELTLRAQRERMHASNAMRALQRAEPTDRYRHRGSSERMTSRCWRRAKRALRAARWAENQIKELTR